MDSSPDVAGHLRELQQQRQRLQYVLQSQSPQQLQTFNRKLTTIYQNTQEIKLYLQVHQRQAQLQQLAKQQKWVQLYFKNYPLVVNKKISYQQMGRILSDKILNMISAQPATVVPVVSLKRIQPVYVPSQTMLQMPNSRPVEQIKSSSSPQLNQDRMKQELQMMQAQLKQQQDQKQLLRLQIQRSRGEYQGKIRSLRQQIQGHGSSNQMLVKQVGQLKRQIQELSSAHSTEVIALTREIQQTKLMSQQKLVNIQHQRAQQQAQQIRKLKGIIQQQRVEKNRMGLQFGALKQQTSKLQQDLQSLKLENQNIQAALDRAAKDKKRLNDEILLYKGQLTEQRNQVHSNRQAQIQRLNQIVYKLNTQLEIARQQVAAKAQQASDRDIKLVEMHKRMAVVQDQKRRQIVNHQLQASRSQQQLTTSFRTELTSKQMIEPRDTFEMEQFHLFFVENPKQYRLRFCRAALKSKELLFKSNQLEIGVIWSRVNGNKIKGVVHYSNNSNFDLTDFKSTIYSPKGISSKVLTILPPLLYTSQQSKEEITFQIMELPLRKVCLQITFVISNQPRIITLILPVLLLKFVQYFLTGKAFPQMISSKKFKCSKLCRNLPSFFEEIKQTSHNTFQIDVAYLPLNLGFKVVMTLQGDMMILEGFANPLDKYQTEVVQEYLNELQFVLS